MEKILEKFASINELAHGSKLFDILETAREIATAIHASDKEDAENALQELENLIEEAMHG